MPKYTADFRSGPALVAVSTFSLSHVHKLTWFEMLGSKLLFQPDWDWEPDAAAEFPERAWSGCCFTFLSFVNSPYLSIRTKKGYKCIY